MASREILVHFDCCPLQYEENSFSYRKELFSDPETDTEATEEEDEPGKN